MERRGRGRVRHGGLTGYHVFLTDAHPLEGRLIDISETGLQVAIEGIEHIHRVRRGSNRGWIHRGRGSSEISPAHEREGTLQFEGHILWTMPDHENERVFAGIQFLAPLALPNSLVFFSLEEE